MTRKAKIVQLGDLVAAAFDEAAPRSADPREVSRLATRVVMQVLRRARAPTEATARQLVDASWAAAKELEGEQRATMREEAGVEVVKE